MTLWKNQVTAGSAHDSVDNLVRNEVAVEHEYALFIEMRLLVFQDGRLDELDMLQLCAECLMESTNSTLAAGVVAGVGDSNEGG
ncbi:unnamed protein product [Clonostachys rosea f. rosea IK726]|uniref:Uncharacterized protein n=1 Tax=Clonostachys rosea f. rosea IK726 TaxID=1349383 RepID=A0ACA9TGC7_BIOOC|nr:unnamed protein product [Clonostachys rosea f. rosea IK726]